MTESRDMALLLAGAAAAAIVVGGATIALGYHCCQDLVRNRKRNKEKIEEEDEDEQFPPRTDLHTQNRYSQTEEDDARSTLFSPTRTASTKSERRSVEEIKARYGWKPKKDVAGTSSIAAQARDKLVERGEKLNAVNEKTEELHLQAENFASLAEELANKMKNRKWWEF